MILVDDLIEFKHKRKKYAHMVSTTSIQELHDFAKSIGVKKHFFHRGNHYDIREEEHKKAIEAGAKLVSSKELVKRMIK